MSVVKFVIALIIGYVLSFLTAGWKWIGLFPVIGTACFIFYGIKLSYGSFLYGISGAGIGGVIVLMIISKCIYESEVTTSMTSFWLWLTPIAFFYATFLILFEHASHTNSGDNDDKQA